MFPAVSARKPGKRAEERPPSPRNCTGMEHLPAEPTPVPVRTVGMAASAGGLAVLRRILAALPPSFPGAILVVMHLDPRHPSLLPEILAARTQLRVTVATEGAELLPGTVYVGPPGFHLTVGDDHHIRLTLEPLVHYARPSADVLFGSLARVYAGEAIGVVCSGSGKDGADGLRAIHDQGGATIVQDPKTSEFAGMPNEAVRRGSARYILPQEEIAACLDRLAAA